MWPRVPLNKEVHVEGREGAASAGFQQENLDPGQGWEGYGKG